MRRSSELVLFDLGLVNGALAIVGETVVHTAPAPLSFVRWARTQDTLTFTENVQGLQQIMLLDLYPSPGLPRPLTAGLASDQRSSCFSSDDARLVFYRSGASGGIMVVPAIGGGETRINRRGVDPNWRR